MYPQKKKLDRRRGQILMMFTLALVPMFALMGLVGDIGYMRFVKMSAQTAAQAAASAAIIDAKSGVTGNWCCSNSETTCPQNLTTASSSLEKGCMYAQKHGFNSANQKVTYQAGTTGAPPTASGSGPATYWVTYRVVQRVPQLFSAILGNRSGVVAARSSTSMVGGSDCIFALNPTASGALQVKGTVDLTANCGIYVNSNSPSALTTNGNTRISATEYDIVGKDPGYSTQSPLTPAPNTGVAPINDPLAYLVPPAKAPYTKCDFDASKIPKGTQTLVPGTYCGGIQVGSNSTYTLNPGTYILVGGGMYTQSTNSILKGTGVFIYNTFDPSNSNLSARTYGPINLSGNSQVSLKAPTTGPYAGILIFEDRDAPKSSDNYGGGSSAVYEGTIYARNAAVTMYGNSSTQSKYLILVADTISMVGTSSFNNDYSLLPTGSPITKIAMVE